MYASVNRCQCPGVGQFKLNVDASFFSRADTISISMVLPEHNGSFIAGKVLRLMAPRSVFEAETIGVREALSWIISRQLHGRSVLVETDSLLTVQALKSSATNYFEVGDVIANCQAQLQRLVSTTVTFIRKQSNRVAHEIARLPCLVNCQNEFTSPPSCLLETLLYDVSK